jgi:hypothetical protein
MTKHKVQRNPSSTGTVKVAADREAAPRFIAGSKWEVVASSLESLWHGPYTVTLRLVDDGSAERGTQRDACPSISRIERRAIEAPAVARVIRALERRLGREDALTLLMEVNQHEAFDRGRCLAEESGRNGIDELVEDVAGWGAGGSMEIEVLERTPTKFFFDVTRCPYFETYRELGLEQYGVAFSCCRDEPFAKGFNPRLRLERAQTIMEGADHCDFRYHLDEELEGERT